MIDFEEDQDEIAVSDTGIDRVSNLAKKQLILELQVAEAEAKVEDLKEQLRAVQEVQLPEAMFELGMSEFKLTTGSKITIQKMIIGHIPKDVQDEAYLWLLNNDASGIIKKELSLDFAKTEVDLAKIRKTIEEALPEQDYAIRTKNAIHPATLNAFCKEQLENGITLPPELFNVHVKNKAKIKL